jgi:hypothetical protein
MRTIPSRLIFLLSCLATSFLLIPATVVAQAKAGDQPQSKKTITIHVTKEVDGKTMVIDTTVVTDGEFDADAFLAEKGVLENTPGNEQRMERRIEIRHPGERDFNWSDSDGTFPDTLKFGDDQEIIFSDKFDRPFPHFNEPGMQRQFHFRMPGDFAPMPGPDFDQMLEGMLRSYGLDDMMPLGEMKQAVVKKKRNGKKVIITFEDRDDKQTGKSNRNKKEEKVYYYHDGGQGMISPGDERVIIQENTGKDQPVKTEKKVIIIKEGKEK